MQIPKDAVCPNCKSENTVMLDSDLEFKKGKPIETTNYACLNCNYKWNVTKEAQL